MLLSAILTPGWIESMANSGNPFIYLVGVLLIGITIFIKKVYDDMKNDRRIAEENSQSREDRLIRIDEEHRHDSKNRENRLLNQLEASSKSFDEITRVVNKISDSQEKMIETQQETIKAVQYLNDDFRLIKNRLDTIEEKHYKD